MVQKDSRQTDEVREVLINAIEVELVTLKAAVSFWTEWIERTSEYVKTATESLSTIRSADKDAGQVLLEVVDASRESVRAMTELPRNAAVSFIQELDELEQKKKAGAKKAGAKKAGAKKGARKKATTTRKTAAKAKAKKRPAQRRARVKP
jgi:hypothetical protein